MNKEFDRKTLVQWESIILRASRWQNPAIVNRDLVDIDPMNTFVMPIMLAPGKHNFFMFTGDEETGILKPYYNRYIGPCRSEPIPQFSKELKAVISTKTYDIAASMFRDWKPDDEQVIENALKHDNSHW